MNSWQLLPAIRDLYSRLPETYLLEPWELHKAEAFVRVILKNEKLLVSGGIRLGHLCDIWRDEGGDPWTISQAVEALDCRVEELPEFDNRRFVFPPAEQVA